MKVLSRNIFILAAAVILSCSWNPDAVLAKPLGLFGTWKWFFQGDDTEESADGLVQFRQLYSVNYVPLVTRKISMNASMGYSNLWLEQSGTREILNPSLQLSVHNDIFNLTLIGNLVKNNISTRADYDTTDFNANMASNWKNKLWPQLALRASHRTEDAQDTQQYPGRETLWNDLGVSVKWEYDKLKLFYDYYTSRQEEDSSMNQSSDQDRVNHLIKAEYGDSYWDRRLSWSFSHLYNQQETDFSFNGSSALLKVNLSNGYAGVDFSPEEGALPGNSGLVNGNLTSSAFTIQFQQPANLAIKTNFNAVDTLYVYTTRDDRLLVGNPGALSWDLYTSSDGAIWQLAARNVSSSFNSDEFRYEVSMRSVQAIYVKLVATGWPPALDVNVTEIEAYSNVAAGSTAGNVDQTVKQHKTEFFVNILPVLNTKLNYSFFRDYNENSGRTDFETEKITHSGRLTWNYSRYFTPSAGFNLIYDNNSALGVADTEDRIYDLRISSTPIDTVDLGLNLSFNEQYEDDDLLLTVNHVSLTTTTAWYPDLSSELTLGYNDVTDEITGDESDSTYINLVVRSQLRKTLHATLQSSYSFSSSDTRVSIGSHLTHGSSSSEVLSNEGGETSLNISWRPSSILSFSLTGRTMYGNNTENNDSLLFNAQYLVFRSSKTSLHLSYNLNASSYNATVHNIGLFWGWDLSEYFRLNTSGNYIFMDSENTWNIYTQLTAKF